MSYQQLKDCRDLERLAQELNFELHLGQGQILLRCREIQPQDDPTGQTVVPYSSWLPLGTNRLIMYGNVTELLMFLKGVEFMKTHVEVHLGLREQVEQVQQRQIQNLQHNATFNKLSQ
jgi:hypothetical protein